MLPKLLSSIYMTTLCFYKAAIELCERTLSHHPVTEGNISVFCMYKAVSGSSELVPGKVQV